MSPPLLFELKISFDLFLRTVELCTVSRTFFKSEAILNEFLKLYFLDFLKQILGLKECTVC